jgi:DNA-binding CsgD family transcriptional regulator
MTDPVQLKTRRSSDIGQLVMSWLDVEERPRILVRDDLTLVWANRPAHTVLAERRDLMLRDGSLAMVNRASAEALANLVRVAGSTVSHWSVAREDGDGRLVMSALRLQTTNGLAAVGITFQGAGSAVAPVLGGFKEAFGLTSAESQVIGALMDGETAGRIGHRLEITIDTVRTHIRNAYVKLDVNSREQMFRRLSPFLQGQ